jgi:hypothetical protein
MSDPTSRGAPAVDDLRRAQETIQQHLGPIQNGYAALADALAASARKLAAAAAEADFSPPPWPEGIERTIEIKLSQTREISFRLGAEQGDAPGPPV